MVAMALLLLVAPGEAYHTALAPAVGRRVGSGIHMGGKKAKYGLFSPIVQGARAVMGEQELLQLRAKVIQAHSKVIAKFVDTSDSRFGQIALRKVRRRHDPSATTPETRAAKALPRLRSATPHCAGSSLRLLTSTARATSTARR